MADKKIEGRSFFQLFININICRWSEYFRVTPTQTSPLGLDKPARLTIVPNYLTFCQIRHKKYGDGDTVYLGAAASSEYFRGGHQAGQKQDFNNF